MLYGPHIDHFVSTCKDRKRKRKKKGEKEGQDETRISERMNGEKELRGRRKKTRSDCSSNSMRGRFGSPIFGPEHFQAHPLRPLQTRPPPRIELSVQISILTANLPANSPLLLISPTPLSRVSFLHRNFYLNADSSQCCKCSLATLVLAPSLYCWKEIFSSKFYFENNLLLRVIV